MTPTAIRKSERISQCGTKLPKQELYSEQLYAMHTEVVTPKKPPSKTMVFTHSSSTPFMVKERTEKPSPLPSPSVPNRETQAASPTCSVTVQPIKIVPLSLPDILSPKGSNGKNFEVKQEICSDDGLISEPLAQVKTESNLAQYFEKLKKEIELELYLRRYMKQKEKEKEEDIGNKGTQNAEQAEQQPMELFVKKESAPVAKKEASAQSSTPSPSSSQGSPWIEHKELESLLIRNVRKDPLTGRLKCPVCGKLITRTFGMKVHMRTHTGEKPHKCEICEATFADRSNLQSHIHTHKDIRPHVCSVCHKEFALKSYLKKHMLLHGGVQINSPNTTSLIELDQIKREDTPPEEIRAPF